MPSFSDNIARQDSGKPISGQVLREMGDRLTRISRDARHQYIELPEAGSAAQIGMFRYKSPQPDYWVCRELYRVSDGTYAELAQDVKIAKPWALRQTPFDSKTITINGVSLRFGSYGTGGLSRIVTKAGTTQNQIVIPYPTTNGGAYDGDVIWAVRNLQRGTGVILNRGMSSEEWLEWLDLNVDGRMWAKA